jgi:hypothetical protein
MSSPLLPDALWNLIQYATVHSKPSGLLKQCAVKGAGLRRVRV